MSKEVDDLPEPVRREEEYPWDEWLNGKIWLLEPGVDFHCRPRSMETQLRSKARDRGKRVHLRVRGEGIYVTAWDRVS